MEFCVVFYQENQNTATPLHVLYFCPVKNTLSKIFEQVGYVFTTELILAKCKMTYKAPTHS